MEKEENVTFGTDPAMFNMNPITYRDNTGHQFDELARQYAEEQKKITPEDMLNATTAVSVAFVKREDTKIFLLLLKHVKCKGLWLMPCGKAEPTDKTTKHAAIREMKEELDITLDVTDLTPISCEYHKYDRIDGLRTFLEQTYYVNYHSMHRITGEGFKNMEPAKHLDMKWICIDDIIAEPGIYSDNTVQTASKLKKVEKTLMTTVANYKATSTKTQKPVLKFFKISPDAIIPEKAHKTDSGFDIFSIEDTLLTPGSIQLIHTGIKVGLPSGFEAQVRPKSGLALKSGITVLNTPGTVDEGYTGEVGVILINASKVDYQVKKGQKIAQLCINKTYNDMQVTEVAFESHLYEETARGEGGFGSTGLEKNN